MNQRKIVIAPDSFKESLTTLEAAQAIQKGLMHVWPDADYELVPMADGGEAVYAHGIDALFSIVPGAVSLDQALSDAKANLIRTSSNIARVWQLASM
jgi:glycerate kinase